MIAALLEMGATLGEIKLYYTDESNKPAKFDVSSLGVGSTLTIVTKINMATMEASLYFYGTDGINYEYNPSAFFEGASGYYVALESAVALTAITPTSGQFVFVGNGFASVVM